MMPRKDTEKAIEFRITLGDKERTLLEEGLQTYRLSSVLGEAGLELVSDPIKMIGIVEAIATLIELFGIDTPIPTPVDAYNWLNEVKNKAEQKGSDWWDVESIDLRNWREGFRTDG